TDRPARDAGAAAMSGARKAMNPSRRTRAAVLHIALVLFGLMPLFPLVWVVVSSLQRSGDLFGNDLLRIPLEPQWHNYARAWADGQIVQYGINSLIVVTASTAISTALSF